MMTETQSMDNHQPVPERNGITEKALSEHSLTLGLGDLPDGIQVKNDGLLSLKDIEARLDVNYSRLQRFANAPGVGEHLGAVKVPGAKGVRYEPRALEMFRRLLAASDANEATPATAAAWLERSREVKSPESGETAITERNAITEKLVSGHSLVEQGQMGFATKLLSGVLAPITAVLQDLTGAIQGLRSERQQIDRLFEERQAMPPPAPPIPISPPQDRLLTAEEAAALLACNPRSVNRHVKEVLPRKWKESDVLRYIEQLTPKTGK